MSTSQDVRRAVGVAAKLLSAHQQDTNLSLARSAGTTNCPKAEEVVKMWKPSTKQKVETDPYVQHCVAEQAWTGLAIKDVGLPKGFGKKTFQLFSSIENTKM